MQLIRDGPENKLPASVSLELAEIIKPILFLAALAACKSNSDLRSFYENLIASGKKKMVALTALMRKIIVRANAKLRGLEPSLEKERKITAK